MSDKPSSARATGRGNPNDLLNGSPYLVPEDDRSLEAFTKTAEMSLAVANRAQRAWLNIASETTSLLEPFLLSQRSELVSESNLIEGYQVSPRQVQDAVITYGELLDGPVHALLEVLRADEKIVTALGLFKAQQIADEWAHRRDRPQAYKLRQLHALITADMRSGGQYRTQHVAIGGGFGRELAEGFGWGLVRRHDANLRLSQAA